MLGSSTAGIPLPVSVTNTTSPAARISRPRLSSRDPRLAAALAGVGRLFSLRARCGTQELVAHGALSAQAPIIPRDRGRFRMSGQPMPDVCQRGRRDGAAMEGNEATTRTPRGATAETLARLLSPSCAALSSTP
ncbi:hypothetical protein WMF18_25890 [Sorangium sp. So ce315]|uniref:hypothetical protein n=1 Tax=Sorangium sp. So ce315 TaxID=3133299 RepID=UPI003F62A777